MATKTVVWSERANFELTEILEYYVNRNGNSKYSLKILSKTDHIIRLLIDNEFVGRLTSNGVTRVIVLDVLLIFYEIHRDQIEILSFWDNRQNPIKRFDNL